MLYEDRDASMIRMFDAFLESAPQLVLQLYVTITESETEKDTFLSEYFSHHLEWSKPLSCPWFCPFFPALGTTWTMYLPRNEPSTYIIFSGLLNLLIPGNDSFLIVFVKYYLFSQIC